MANLQRLRESIRQRLAAAGAEILSECENSLIHTEEQTRLQRKMLDAMKSEARERRINDIKQEEEEEEDEEMVDDDEHLSDQEKDFSLDEEDSKPSQVKEEQEEEPCTSQCGTQLVLKEEVKTCTETSNESDSRESVGHDTCGKASNKKSQMKTHSKAGAKPFSCKVCGKGFNYQASYVHHMRIHSNEKPFSCKTCGKTFRRSDKLVLHTRTHTAAV